MDGAPSVSSKFAVTGASTGFARNGQVKGSIPLGASQARGPVHADGASVMELHGGANRSYSARIATESKAPKAGPDQDCNGLSVNWRCV